MTYNVFGGTLKPYSINQSINYVRSELMFVSVVIFFSKFFFYTLLVLQIIFVCILHFLFQETILVLTEIIFIFLFSVYDIKLNTPQGQHCSKIMKPPQSLLLQMAERYFELSQTQ